MADEEHLAILKQGVEIWNEWREQYFEIEPDLSGADLSGADLSTINLRYADLGGADLSDVNLSNADLSSANLRYANLREANLHEVYLSETILIAANLSNADLSSANLRYANLREANLHEANFNSADLSSTDLGNTDLSSADLFSTDLREANLFPANLLSADLRETYLNSSNLGSANLSNADLRGASLSNANLVSADLSNANLGSANLSNADLRGASLSNANLSGADLSAVQALAADFSHTILTGVCIKDWNINTQTQLQDVECKYVYLGYNYAEEKFDKRRPHDPNKIFTSSEFTERFQKVLDTVDLFFTDGIDWKAFLASLQKLQAQYGHDNLMVQGFERKGNGFEVRLAVSSDLDKAEIEHNALQKYKAQLQMVEIQYRAELRAKDKEIESYRRESANMMEITKLLASKPITVQAKAEAVADNQSKNTNYNLQGSKFGGGFAAEGGIQIGGQFVDASSQQNLAEAAQDIQALLNQLSTTYPTTTSAQQMVVATKAVEEIEKNSALKQRVIAALKAGGTEALKELVNHPAVNILLTAIEGWQNLA